MSSPGGERAHWAALRASDAERDAVAASLERHLRDGRLEAAEFSERVDQALAARTYGDLDHLLADLPRLPPPAPARSSLPHPARGPALARLAATAALAVIFVAAVGTAGWAAQGGGTAGPHSAWGHLGWSLWWLTWLTAAGFYLARRRAAMVPHHRDQLAQGGRGDQRFL